MGTPPSNERAAERSLHETEAHDATNRLRRRGRRSQAGPGQYAWHCHDSHNACLDGPDLVLGRHRQEVLAGIDEAIVFRAVLFLVELTISAAQGDERAMRPALHDLAVLEDQD